MKRPEMILFDYGNTIITEKTVDFVKANEMLLGMAVTNPCHITVDKIQERVLSLIKDLEIKTGAADHHHYPIDVSWNSLNRCVYEYFGITFDRPYSELQKLFWDSATPDVCASPHIRELLNFLHDSGIRTGVVSNIMYSYETLSERINRLIPDNHFEFIICISLWFST